MEMFLVTAAISLLGVVVSAALFLAATHDVRGSAPTAHKAEQPLPASRFFADDRAPRPDRVPVETIVLQIERHVRLEQAAAESFHFAPTADALHSRTVSHLVH